MKYDDDTKGVESSALVTVYLSMSRTTVRDVRDWLAEVDRLRIPDDTEMDDCLLGVCYRSDIVDTIHGESELGVEGVDILVGMPR